MMMMMITKKVFTVSRSVAVHGPGWGWVVGWSHVARVWIQRMWKEHIADILRRKHSSGRRFEPVAHSGRICSVPQPSWRMVLLSCHRHADVGVVVTEIRGEFFVFFNKRKCGCETYTCFPINQESDSSSVTWRGYVIITWYVAMVISAVLLSTN